MVTWAGLYPSKDWVYVLNRHFSDTIFDVFHWTFVGQACQSKADTFLFPFLEYKVPAHPTVFELQAKTWCSMLEIDDDDADWLLGGAKAEPIHWRCKIYLKARPRVPSTSRIICLARNQDGPQTNYGSDSLNSGPGRPHRAHNWAWRQTSGSKFVPLNTKVRLNIS